MRDAHINLAMIASAWYETTAEALPRATQRHGIDNKSAQRPDHPNPQLVRPGLR
jgi:hypothetical protein